MSCRPKCLAAEIGLTCDGIEHYHEILHDGNVCDAAKLLE